MVVKEHGLNNFLSNRSMELLMSLLADDARYWQISFELEPSYNVLWKVYSEMLFQEIIKPIWIKKCISSSVIDERKEIDFLCGLINSGSSQSREKFIVFLKEKYNLPSSQELNILLLRVYFDIQDIYNLYAPS